MFRLGARHFRARPNPPRRSLWPPQKGNSAAPTRAGASKIASNQNHGSLWHGDFTAFALSVQLIGIVAAPFFRSQIDRAARVGTVSVFSSQALVASSVPSGSGSASHRPQLGRIIYASAKLATSNRY